MELRLLEIDPFHTDMTLYLQIFFHDPQVTSDWRKRLKKFL